MQRKPGFPNANCNIKMPDSISVSEGMLEEEEPLQRRQQLINFGHSQWGFNNWSWAVTKQDLDFIEISNGKYSAGVVAFVSVTVKSLDIHRENIGYATSLAPYKGAAIHNARKCAVTNALRETLLSFGGNVTTELMELLDAQRHDVPNQNQNQNQTLVQNQKHVPPDPVQENNQNIANTIKHGEKNVVKKEEVTVPVAPLKNVPNPPVAKTHPMPTNLPPSRQQPTATVRDNALNPPVGKTNPMPSNLPPSRPQPTANVSANVPAHRHDVRPPAPQPLHRPNSNEVKLEDLNDEEARAERKRRQKQAQEEFRLKQLLKQKETDEVQDVNKNSSLDTLLMAIPSQDIVIEETGNTGLAGKRKSPASDASCSKRRSVLSKLDIIKN